MKKQILFLFIPYIFFFVACSQPKDAHENIFNSTSGKQANIQYAKRFNITKYGDITLLEVPEPYKGAKEGFSYWLIPKGMPAPDSLKNTTVIYTPVSSLVCTSTTHLVALDLLDESPKLVGFPSTQYISSERIRKQVEDGITREVGRDNNLNIEVMLELDPELLISYSLTGDYSKISPFEKSGITVIQNAAFLEETPLGRAEWIKFTGLLFDKEKEADSIFQIIESSYLNTLQLVKTQDEQPTVFSGVVYGDTWFMPGGNSWVGKFFKDANANFLWKDNIEAGNVELSFEAVYEKAYTANYWIGAANFHSINELKSSDQRYTSFEAYSNDKVYTYNARQIPNGGNDYFESGSSRPDIILKDLVKIIHPNLLPEHELYFYKKLD